MKTINFYLAPNGSIYTRFFPIPYDEVKFYIKEIVNKRDWSHSKQRVKYTNDRYIIINKLIEAVSQFIADQLTTAKIEGKCYTSDQFKQILNDRFFGKSDHQINKFKDYAILWLDNKRPSIKPGTLKAYRSKLKAVSNLFPDLDINDIDNIMYKQVQRKLFDCGKYKHNSIVKTLKIFKSVINEAYEDGLISNQITTNLNIGYKSIKSIYHNWDQLSTLFYFNYSSDKLANAVKLYLIGAFSGQRYVDFVRISNKMKFVINDKEYIRLKQIKTGATVTIPLRPELKLLLDNPPHPIAPQNLRDYIKEAAKEAGLSDYDKIGTHTARRSFATNYVLDGVPMHLVMKMGGWKTEASFRSYIKYDDVIAGVEIATNENYIKALDKFA